MPDPSVAKALQEAKKLVATLEAYDDPNPVNHLAVLAQANNVRNALEGPFDVITRMTENTCYITAVHALIRIKAFDALPADGSAISATELARLTNVDVIVIQRLFRAVVVFGATTEPEPDHFAHNDISRAFDLKVLGCFLFVCVEFTKAWVHLPDYLASHKPEDIFDLRKCPANFSKGKGDLGKTYYEVLDMDPEYRAIWNANMAAVDKNMPILGMYPFASLRGEVEADPSRAFLVDIAGGRGQSALAILGEMGEGFAGEAILQELPIVVDTLDPAEVPGVKVMKYDAGTPQPVKNAHVYFMRRFLHDFYNDKCIDFVKNTASAMGPDSKLLICDMLVPEKTTAGEAPELYWLDMALMTMTGKEKKLSEFEEIFEAAGLELVKVHESGYGRTVIVEAKLKQGGAGGAL